MLLTLTASSFRRLLKPQGTSEPLLSLANLPVYVRKELGLYGLNFTTELLAGSTRSDLENLREQADKARCACLLLIEPEPQPFGGDADAARAAQDRTCRVIEAAHVLGCTSAAIGIAADDSPAALELVADRVREVVNRAERLELNLLISPIARPGELTAEPDRVTELIKKIGGFRVGTLPDFEAAGSSADGVGYLRRIAPYAGSVTASTVRFAGPPRAEAADRIAAKAHEPYDLGQFVQAVASVGYDGTLAIDYRGDDDPIQAVLDSRDALEAALQALSDAR